MRILSQSESPTSPPYINAFTRRLGRVIESAQRMQFLSRPNPPLAKKDYLSGELARLRAYRGCHNILPYNYQTKLCQISGNP